MNIEIIKIIPEYFKAILSWPVAILILSLIFIFRFSEEIKEFLKHARFFKAGPVEIESQAEIAKVAKSKKHTRRINQDLQHRGVTLNEEQIKQLETEFTKLTEESSAKDREIKNKEQLINYLIYRSELYEFLYLSLFLVQNSKFVLLWFYSQVGATKELFALNFQSSIVSPLEREAIFNALLNNGLIELSGLSYKISEKGIRFLRFVGLIK